MRLHYAAIIALLFFASTAAAISVTGCRDLNVAGATFVLQNNISNANPSSGMCFRVTEDNVTLDCANFVVDGTSSNTKTAVGMIDQHNITIQNCHFSEWRYGFQVWNGSSDVEIINTGINSASTGVSILSSNNNILDGVDTVSGVGIMVDIHGGSSGNMVKNGFVEDAGIDVLIIGGSGNTIQDMNFHHAGGTIIRESSGNTFQRNVVDTHSTTGTGLTLVDSNNNTVKSNYFYGSGNAMELRSDLATTQNNMIYDNDFNTGGGHVYFSGNLTPGINTWNVSPTTGPNKVGGSQKGGNHWAGYDAFYSPDYGFSQACPNENSDSFCDQPHWMDWAESSNNVDNYPLTLRTGPADINGCNTTLWDGTQGDGDGWHYRMTNDVVDSPTSVQHCLEIRRDDVLVDCDGHTIDGVDNANWDGIRVLGSRSEVKNCTITDWRAGLNIMQGSNLNNIHDNNFNSNSTGVSMTSVDFAGSEGSSSNLVADNNFKENVSGMGMNGKDSHIVHNRFEFNSTGLTSGPVAQGNVVYDNWFDNNVNATAETGTGLNDWNAAKEPGTNIAGGPFIGGNYWLKADGNGFSHTCNDGNGDSLCDDPYSQGLGPLNADNLPLTFPNKSPLNRCSPITGPGRQYFMVRDIIGSTATTCFAVDTNNIVFDCNNKKIDGVDLPTSTGVLSSNNKFNVFANCQVSDWGSGFRFASAGRGVISNGSSNSNAEGIRFDDANDNRVFNMALNDNTTAGLSVSLSSDNSLEVSTLWGNNAGVAVADSVDNSFKLSDFAFNSYAFRLSGASEDNEFSYNSAKSSSTAGVELAGSAVQDNLLYNNDFNNATNAVFTGVAGVQDWNIPLSSGSNIKGGSLLGGNFWATPTGDGFSEGCLDVSFDGICDEAFEVVPLAGNFDYRALGVPPSSTAFCGNQDCEEGETCSNCPDDCGECPAVCGDLICEEDFEHCSVCPQDCGLCTSPVCGDGNCNTDLNENNLTCPSDCPGFFGNAAPLAQFPFLDPACITNPPPTIAQQFVVDALQESRDRDAGDLLSCEWSVKKVLTGEEKSCSSGVARNDWLDSSYEVDCRNRETSQSLSSRQDPSSVRCKSEDSPDANAAPNNDCLLSLQLMDGNEYEVTLTVTDRAGLSDSFTRTAKNRVRNAFTAPEMPLELVLVSMLALAALVYSRNTGRVSA